MATDEVPKIQGASVSRKTTFMKLHNVMYCNVYTLQAIGGNDPSLSLVTVHVYVFHLNFFIRQMRRPNPAFYNCSVLPRPLLQGAAPCPLFVTPCPFEKAEMTPCPFDPKKKKKKKNISHTWLLALFCPFCCPHTAWIVLCIFY